MVVETLLRGFENAGIDVNPFHYRTCGGAEIDLTLEGQFCCIFIAASLESQHQNITASELRLKMRTTLDIDDAVLAAAKEMARNQNLSTGRIVSELLRKAMTGQAGRATAPAEHASVIQNAAGFRPFPAGQAIVTNEAVNRLRETEGI